jgi:hypothetical protein
VPIEEDGERLHDGGLEGEDAREEAELVTMEEAGLAVLRGKNARLILSVHHEKSSLRVLYNKRLRRH